MLSILEILVLIFLFFSAAYKDQKSFLADLKKVYGAESEEIALRNLETMQDTWKKYAVVLDNWLDKWDHLSTKDIIKKFKK